MEDKTIDYKKRKNSADILVSHMAYVYDFNFDYGLFYIYNNKYIEKLYNRFSFKDQKTTQMYNKIYETAINFIKEKIEKKR